MVGAPRNPAPRNHLQIVKPSGCHCTEASGGEKVAERRSLLGALPPAGARILFIICLETPW